MGPWCAAAVLLELLRPKQANNLLDQFGEPGSNRKYRDDGPDADAIRKTPGSYMPHTSTGTSMAEPLAENGVVNQSRAHGKADANQDTEMADVFPVKKTAPVSPEVQALNIALKEVAQMLTQALPINKRRRAAASRGKVSHLPMLFLGS